MHFLDTLQLPFFPDTPHAYVGGVCELRLYGVSFEEGGSELVVGKATEKIHVRCRSFPQ
jgi:hypothetical protein